MKEKSKIFSLIDTIRMSEDKKNFIPLDQIIKERPEIFDRIYAIIYIDNGIWWWHKEINSNRIKEFLEFLKKIYELNKKIFLCPHEYNLLYIINLKYINVIVRSYLNKESKKAFNLFLSKDNFVYERIKKNFISNIEKYTNKNIDIKLEEIKEKKNIFSKLVPNIMTEVCEDIYSREKIYNKGNRNSLENISSKKFIHIYPKKIFDLYNESLYKSLLFRINPVLVGICCGKSSFINFAINEKLVLDKNEKNIKCKERNKKIFFNQIDKEEILYPTFLEGINDNQNFYIEDYEIIIDNIRDKNSYINSLDYIEDKKTYEFEKKLKCLKHFNENRHFFCKKCYSVPKVELELEFEKSGKIRVFCSCEPDKFDKENEKNKKISDYIVNKYELINNEKENFIINSFLCNKHIKKYKYFCNIYQKNLCRKCLQKEEAHNMHDLILFDFISDKIKKKIDFIKQIINTKLNLINNIYFNGNKIDIGELLNLIISDYSEYKNYNLIKSIENIYEFLISKEQEILFDNYFLSLFEEKDHLSSLLEPLPKKEVLFAYNFKKMFYQPLPLPPLNWIVKNDNNFFYFKDYNDFGFKVDNLFCFKVCNTKKKEEYKDDLCEKSILLFLDGTTLYLLNFGNLERLLIKEIYKLQKTELNIKY